MRILMLAPHPSVRGPLTKHTPVLVEALRSIGCHVALEPWGRHHDRERWSEKIFVRSLDIPRVRRVLEHEEFDVMVVKTSHEWRSLLANLPLLAATRRLVPRIVVQFHGGRSDLLVAPGHGTFKLASAALFALCDGVLVLSTEEARESQSFWPRGRFRVVMNPFVRSADGDSVRQRTDHRREGSLTVLFVGRLIKEKGIFETLSAFASVVRKHECHLVIAGDGPSAADVAKRVTELDLNNKVTLTGFLSGEPLLGIYRDSDIFVLPTYHCEGFPTAITEALASGLPVVTTRARGMADHLVERENAVFVAPRDRAGLATALEHILSDPQLRHRMSVANRAKVGEFMPETVARQYLETLTDIVEHRAAGSRKYRGQ
ncbi:MAG: glycosyltransferase family 4 protein [Solirubrobacterales bacterium]|nr:glycosyltransferase family 4 protein [Solirubrobacterales bacterium]